MKPLQKEALRRLSVPRIWTPTGFLSPVDVAFAQKWDWVEGFKHFDPNAYTPEQWTHLTRLRARAWLEQECWLPVPTAMFVADLGLLLAGGFVQSFTNKDTFASPDAGSSYVVNGAAAVLITKLWGAGGGGAQSTHSASVANATVFGGHGGGGGYVGGTFNVTPGETLTKRIGGGGGAGVYAVGAGGGGGYSALLRVATFLLIAAGGAGGGNAYSTNPQGFGGYGGAGGGSVGQIGQQAGTVYGNELPGQGGTQSAGGAFGTSTYGPATAGASLQGGNGAKSSSGNGGGAAAGVNGGGTGGGIGASPFPGGGGGGGGGYFGGGGGGTENNGAGGGGGSNLSGGTDPVTLQGNLQTPGNDADADRGGTNGNGGTRAAGRDTGTATAGVSGRVTIYW